MNKKVRITKTPNTKGPGNLITPQMSPTFMSTKSQPDVEVKKTLNPVDERFANVEVERGEMVMYPDTKAFPGFPSIYEALGKRHSEGGTPLSLPEDAFVFSDTRSMKIKDPSILAMFGKSMTKKNKKGFLPSDLAGQYDINEYIKVLSDDNSTDIERSTAEQMIKNYNMKLGKLALVQESMKGFPDGVPAVSIPYLYSVGVQPEAILGTTPQTGPVMPQQNTMPMTAPSRKEGGSLTKLQGGGQVSFPDDATAKKWNNNIQAYSEFQDATQNILGNPELIKDLVTQYRSTIENDKAYTKGKKDKYYNNLKTLSEQEIIDQLLAQEERNARLSSFGFNASKTEQNASGENTNTSALEFKKNHPDGLGDLNWEKGYQGQAAYIAYRDLMKTDKYKGYAAKQYGVGDETINGQKGAVSGIDNYNTNTTLGQRLGYLGKKEPQKEQQIQQQQVQDQVGNYNIPQTNYQQKVSPAKWWTQDIVNVNGAIQDNFMLKKENPYLQTVDLQKPSPAFISPERKEAANQEQMNIALQATGAFAGPQAQSARMSSIQGSAATNSANNLAQTHNQNVGIANQFELYQNQIKNQEIGANAQAVHNFYDQTVLANQNYDNAKMQARQTMRGSYNQGLTNAQQTAALNAMYPHFQTDPYTGSVYFQEGSKMSPGNAAYSNPQLSAYAQARQDPSFSDLSNKELIQLLGKGDMTLQNNYPDPTNQTGYGYNNNPGNQSKFGGELKRVRIKRLPR